MAKKDLSHEEVWDDSALVNSWNDALEEYKKYHSLAAKGEMVDLVLDKAEAGLLDEEEPETVKPEQPTRPQKQPPLTNGDAVQATSDGPTAAGAQTPHAQAAPATMPLALLNNVQDDGLKNIMMSWYYAGYYTGLYEGQQKAHDSMVQQG
ncbi:hypothetical protein LTR36_008190 [Oleoguttula mirabilis]|uniref:Survival Motor Neuron Gemin2-binding domain-containing protein n=1 Tax=Oleoguttula mirabilis TaxID=1507867 RepID=A0AAV9J858_9PEZI|nr:hypothetical protein LTR36_008190 [Oleoguttula mirabilis]